MGGQECLDVGVKDVYLQGQDNQDHKRGKAEESDEALLG